MKIDLQKIWSKLENTQYLVLRNFDKLQEEVDSGGDIDLLCESREEMIEVLKLAPRFKEDNLNNCKVIIDGVSIPIDVRYIGDGYYDSKWEADMLRRRTKIGTSYMLSKTDEKYSLLYHVLLHKNKIPEKYNDFIRMHFVSAQTELLCSELGQYLMSNHYQPVFPKDKGVCFNEKNYRLLMEYMLDENK